MTVTFSVKKHTKVGSDISKCTIFTITPFLEAQSTNYRKYLKGHCNYTEKKILTSILVLNAFFSVSSSMGIYENKVVKL